MHPSSQTQFDAFAKRTVPPVEEVREGIWAVPNPFPGTEGVLTSTLCYLLEGSDGAVHLIDAGLGHDAGFEAIRQAVTATGHALDDLATITITHLHSDHLGLADRLRTASGARILLHEREQHALDNPGDKPLAVDQATLARWGVPDERRAELLGGDDDAESGIRADVLFEGGEQLPIAGRRVRVLHTPGHTAGSISLVAEEERLVFTGDTLLPVTYPGIGLGGADAGAIAGYGRSLRTIEELDVDEACPGHEFRFTSVAQRCRTTLEHHLRRSREVAAVVSELADGEELTVWQLASRLHWSAGFANLRGFNLRSALAQTVMHREFVESPDAAEFLGEHAAR